MANVLVIDSDTTFLAKAKESLEHRNHRVVSARTLVTAIERLKRHQPDIVILVLFSPIAKVIGVPRHPYRDNGAAAHRHGQR